MRVTRRATLAARRSHRGGPAASATAAALAALLLVSPVLAAPRSAEPTVDEGRLADPGPARTAEADAWRALLLRASEAARQRRYTGESLWITWSDGDPHVVLSQVHRDRDNLTVSFADRFTVRLGEEGADMLDEGEGWLVPLPVVDADDAHTALAALEEKYAVTVTGQDRLLDRPCTRMEVRLRADDSLRERLWVDEDSGLLLRRESFEGVERRLRLVTYLSLDLRPDASTGSVSRAARPQDTERLQRRSHAISPLDTDALSALRQGGWTVPATLPGDYEPVGMFAVDDSESQPLQVVYRDGLYTMSLFQQRGRPDWESLPEGAQVAEDLDWHAYEWPGAVPQRLVWEASGTTFSLVGDAPPEEFIAIAGSLPTRQGTGLVERLRRGFGRLWGWLSQ